MSFSFAKWLKAMKARLQGMWPFRPRLDAHKKRPCRLMVQQLEDRVVPAITTFEISPLDASNFEGTGGGTTPLTFTVTRGGDLSVNSTINWAVSSTTMNTADFPGGVFPSNTLQFLGAATSQTITVLVNADADYESNEGFAVTLSNAQTPGNDTLIITPTATGAVRNDDPSLFSQLQATYGFHSDGNYFQNALKANEKWIQDRNNNYFTLVPAGNLLQWNNSSLATSPVIANVGVLAFDDPTLLLNAPNTLDAALSAQLVLLRETNGFYSKGNYYQNGLGFKEKWFQDRNDKWFALVPSGNLVQYTGGNFANAPVVANVGPLVFDDPTRLLQAPVAPSAAILSQLTQLREAYGFHFAGSYYQNAVGSNEKWLQDRNNRFFTLVPNGNLIQWNNTSLATSTVITNLGGLVFDDPNRLFNASVTLPANILSQLTVLRETYGFRTDGNYFQNATGSNEKWIKDRNNNYFAITPIGNLVQWNGTSFATSPTIANVGALVFDDPTRLINAAFTLGANTITQLASLRQTYGFHSDGNYLVNSLGKNEKWFQDRFGEWYALTPVGNLVQWNGTKFTTSPVIANVGVFVYDDPTLLLNAAITLDPNTVNQLATLRQAYGFHYTGSYHQNALKFNEKWFQDRNGDWYILRPTGNLVQWNGTSIGTSPTIALLGSLVFDDPTRLFEAPITLDTSVIDQLAALRLANGFHTAGNYFQNALGFDEKWFQDRTDRWFNLAPNGDLVRWNGVSFLSSPVIANVTVFAYDDPTLLFRGVPTGAVDLPIVTAREGNTANNSGSYTTTTSGGQVTLSASKGTVVNNGDGTWSWSFSTNDGPENSDTVFIYANDGRFTVAIARFDLLVTNVAPTGTVLNAALTVNEGSIANNSGTYADPGNDLFLTLSASVGTITDNFNGTWSWTFNTTDGPDETGTVLIYADDGEVAVVIASFSLTVRNVAPTGSVQNANVTVNEGSTAINLGTYFDPGDDYHLALSASKGTVIDNFDGTWIWTYDTRDGPDDSGTIQIFANDGSGAVTIASFALTVNNVAPTGTATQPTVTVNSGATATNTGTYFDPGNDHPLVLAASIGAVTNNLNGTWSWSLANATGANAGTVTITANDGQGVVTITTFNLAVLGAI